MLNTLLKNIYQRSIFFFFVARFRCINLFFCHVSFMQHCIGESYYTCDIYTMRETRGRNTSLFSRTHSHTRFSECIKVERCLFLCSHNFSSVSFQLDVDCFLYLFLFFFFLSSFFSLLIFVVVKIHEHEWQRVLIVITCVRCDMHV